MTMYSRGVQNRMRSSECAAVACAQHERRGAHVRLAQDGAAGPHAAGARAARRARRAPALQPRGLVRTHVHTPTFP